MKTLTTVTGLTLILFILNLFNAPTLLAKANEDKTLSPYFLINTEDAETDRLPLQSTSAEVNIAGVIADVTVTQVYKNEGLHPLEAIYVFPTSTKAAVYGMTMNIGDRTIVAQIKERGQARREYEAAKIEGKRTSLLQQDRPNVFQMSVANIMPGDIIKVELKYTEMLVPEEGVYEFVYPTVVGPRFSNTQESEAGEHDSFVNSPFLPEGKEAPYTFDINVNLSAGMPIQEITSTSHQIDVNYEEMSAATVALGKSETNGGNRDYILRYRLAGDKIASGLLLYEHEDEKFFTLMVQPPKRVTPEQIAPREYIFIVDVSGSMRGFPLDISKKLLRDLILGLKPTDKFNVLLFASRSGAVSDTSMFANEANVEKAINVIDNRQGGGGTQLLPAMKEALNLPRVKGMSRSVVIVTDGYVHVEQETFDLMREHMGDANMFTFGTGRSVNRYLLEGMAHVGKGMPMVITEKEGAHEQAEKFRQYINAPVLTQVSANFGDFEVYEADEQAIPDLLAERPLILTGKFKGNPQGEITIKGYAGDEPFEVSFNVDEYRASHQNSAIRYLWAREKIKLLDDYNGVAKTDQRIKEITELGLNYNLMTAYTSFLAVDQEVVNKPKPTEYASSAKASSSAYRTVRAPSPLPSGVSSYAVGFDLSIEGVVKRSANKVKERKQPEPIQVKLLNASASSEMNIKLQQVIEAHVQSLTACGTDLSNLTIALTLNKKGQVTSVKIMSKGLDKATIKCLEANIKQWQFHGLNSKEGIQVQFQTGKAS